VICLAAGEGAHSAQGLRPQDIGVDRDACLTRPFGPRTLVARVRAAARAALPSQPPGRYAAGRLDVDQARRLVRLDGREIALTGTEFDVLSQLAHSAGRVVSRAALRAAVWGALRAQRDDGDRAADRIVDLYIAQLRAKLGPVHGIRTVRGIGYVFDPNVHGKADNPGGRASAQRPDATIGDAGYPS
ncbi:MAG: winged helix-turn-helix domain-containing protein, partial [Streptosporangiaceae bacterium]